VGTQRLEHEGNYIYIICRHNGLAGVCMADTEYPQRVAFAIITKCLDDFQEQVLARRGRKMVCLVRSIAATMHAPLFDSHTCQYTLNPLLQVPNPKP
jgi:hypothetical protein